MVVAFQVFDCLVYRDPGTMEIKPALATSWKQVDDTTIDFTLRQGVTFQNGDKFSADDVVYTINTILHTKQVAVPQLLRVVRGGGEDRRRPCANQADRGVAGGDGIPGDGHADLAEGL